MAFLLTKGDWVVVVAGSELRVLDWKATTTIARIGRDSPSETNAEGSVREEDDECPVRGQILAGAFSPSGLFLAILDDHKNLKLWQTTKSGLSLVGRRVLLRRPTAVDFVGDDVVLVADKSGDAYALRISDVVGNGDEDVETKVGDVKDSSPKNDVTEKSKENGNDDGVASVSGERLDSDEWPAKRILGHLGMLLDVKASNDGKFVLTCDRDEKIRVSHFPNAYNVECFHLGHTQFVYRLCIPQNFDDFFFSGGGDGTIMLWKFGNPKPRFTIHLHKDLATSSQSPRLKCLDHSAISTSIVVAFADTPTVLVYRYSASSDEPRPTFHQRFNPDATVFDVKFDAAGDLWFFVDAAPYLRRFRLDAASDVFARVEDDNVSKLLNATFVEGASKASSLFGILEKNVFDNVKIYLETKEKRLAGGAARWGGGKGKKTGEDTETTEAKKIKL